MKKLLEMEEFDTLYKLIQQANEIKRILKWINEVMETKQFAKQSIKDKWTKRPLIISRTMQR